MTNKVPEFIRGKKGGQQMVLGAYCYTKSSNKGEKIIWECCDRKCRARAVTDRENHVISLVEHNHQTDSDQCAAKRIRSNMVGTIEKNPNQQINAIIQHEISAVPPSVSTFLPTKQVY